MRDTKNNLRFYFYYDKKVIDNLYYQLNENVKTIKTYENNKKQVNVNTGISNKLKSIFGLETNLGGQVEKEKYIEKNTEISYEEKIDYLIDVADGSEDTFLHTTISKCVEDNIYLVVGKAQALVEKARHKDYFDMQILNFGTYIPSDSDIQKVNVIFDELHIDMDAEKINSFIEELGENIGMLRIDIDKMDSNIKNIYFDAFNLYFDNPEINMKASKNKCFDSFSESTLPPIYYKYILGLTHKSGKGFVIKPLAWYSKRLK